VLRVAEQFHASDLGRQRQGNEDNYFVRSPLFVVADGMGGAQAGEVASEMAVASFDHGVGDGSPAESLVRIIEEANRRIHERSRSDAQHAGMGTTCTAIYVGPDDVTLAHVGDSRAYLWREGDLIRLTRDHSLVGELVARGKLTEEQAEAHPQRSVITRALGPEAEVQVDVEVLDARGGDVFLMCSDGLTSMIHEPGVRPIMERAESLEQAGRELIAAANEAGGRDNITVVLFRLEEVESRGSGDGGGAEATAVAEPEGQTTEYDTFEGEAIRPRGMSRPQGHTRQRDGAGEPVHASAGDDTEAEYRASGTVALSAIRPLDATAEAPPPRTAPLPDGAAATAPREPGRKRRRRVPTGLVVSLILVAVVLGGAWLATRAVYFVGTDPDGRMVTIYRGLPYELPFGIDLYEEWYESGVPLADVPENRRDRFTDHQLRSRDDAEDLVIALEKGQVE
jgi:PPM family protein phosphatase